MTTSIKRSNKNRAQARDIVREKLGLWYLDANPGLPESEVQPCEVTDAYGDVIFYYEPVLKNQTNYCVIERALGNDVWVCSIQELPEQIAKAIRSFGGI